MPLLLADTFLDWALKVLIESGESLLPLELFERTRHRSADDEAEEPWFRDQLNVDFRFTADGHSTRRYSASLLWGLRRTAGGYTLSLETASGTETIPLSELGEWVVASLGEHGLGDATEVGLRRAADELLRQRFGVGLPDAATPATITPVLMTECEALQKRGQQGRGRVFFDAATGHPARGKWGWIETVVGETGRAMLVTELMQPLRDRYQDCEESLLGQLRNFPDEIAAHSFGFVPVDVYGFPDVVLPPGWAAGDAVASGLDERLDRFVRDVGAGGGRSLRDLPAGPLRDEAIARAGRLLTN